MPPAIIGIIIGILLAIATVDDGGFFGLVVAIAFGAIGGLAGGHLGGQFDVRELLRGKTGE